MISRSAHLGEGRDPVVSHGAMSGMAVEDHTAPLARPKRWVPAFAGMSGQT